MKDLDISCDAITVVEENTGRKTSNILCSNIFANISPKTREIKEKKMGLHQIKKLLHHHQNEKRTNCMA